MKKLGTPSVEELPSVDGKGGVTNEGDGGAACAAPCPVVPVGEWTLGACPERGRLGVARGWGCRSRTCGAGAGVSVLVVVGVVVVTAGGGGSGVGGAGTVVVPVVVVDASELSAVTVGSTCAHAGAVVIARTANSTSRMDVDSRFLMSVAEQVVEQQAARFRAFFRRVVGGSGCGATDGLGRGRRP